MNAETLRPLERTVLKRADDGMSPGEIAWRLRRSPGSIRRILDLTKLDRDASSFTSDVGQLRPIERCVLKALDDGSDPSEIAARLKRSPGFVRRVEQLANYKLSKKGPAT